MSSESAAYQAAQQRHHHYMVFGKKQRYIEVFQCSGEDMNHVLTGNTAAVAALAAAASPVKSSASTTSQQPPPTNTVAAALASGLLPPGMFPSHQAIGNGFADPNLFAASQMQSPFLLLNQFGFPDSGQLGLRPAAVASGAVANQPSVARTTPVTSTADMSALFGLQAQQALFMNMPIRAQQPMGLMAYNQALAAQQYQLQQQQLLQNQLAAQRLFMNPGGQAASGGLIGPRPQNTKRSFDTAFNGQNADDDSKRANYGLSTPTISAGPTTYSR